MLDAIKQWALTLVITAVVGTLANSLAVSENSSMKKYVKFACSAVALAVMIMPLKGLFTDMPRMFDFNNYNNINSTVESQFQSQTQSQIYDCDLNELTVAKTTELLKERISDIVYEKTGIKPDMVYIYINQEDYWNVGFDKIIIILPENIDADKNDKNDKTEDVKLYFKQLFNCDVDITDAKE